MLAKRFLYVSASLLLLALPRVVGAQVVGISQGDGQAIVAMANGDTFSSPDGSSIWVPGPNMLAQTGRPPTERVVGLVSTERDFSSQGLYAMTDAGTILYRSGQSWDVSINIFQSAGRPPGRVVAFGGFHTIGFYAVAEGGDAFHVLSHQASFIGNIFNAPTPAMGTTWGEMKDRYRR